MNCKVISVFAGLGKSFLGKKYKNVCDLRSSSYRYDYSSIKEKEFEKLKCLDTLKVNSKWPSNYIDDLKNAIQNYDIVLVPSNEDIRNLLIENHIEFIFVLPSVDSREILLERYKKRGNNQKMIKEVMNYFDKWSRKQEDYSYPIYILNKNEYLEDLLKKLKFIEQGVKE